ncbi:MAG: histidine--tRNA ligase [Patescibacteria group bacterium]|nr:histidine--tRNA ligase [Patescibacteria group bacterium]
MATNKRKALRPKKEKKGKKMILQSPKGMHDILPTDQPFWDKIKSEAKKIADIHNFSKIETPILENAAVFERSLGENSDIVEKQMFFIKTRGGDHLVMRPEGTAPIIRAYYEHGLSRLGHPLKLYYEGPMFRYEQPQAGRFRQFYQVGFEILGGESDPIYDVQAILTPFRLLEELKIKDVIVHINSVGCLKCRGAYQKKLEAYYRKHQKKICKNCQKRLETNPLRLLDCKEEKCQLIKTEAPIILNFLCEPCKAHFKKVLEYMDEVKIPYFMDPYLVRGLDYYNRTVFEIFTEGFDFAIASGGRYDFLAEILKLGKLSAVGSGVGVDRIVEIFKTTGKVMPLKNPPKVFFIHIGEEAKKKGFVLVEEFRKAGIKISESFGRESLKSQLRIADKEKSELAFILGQKEVFEENIIIRDMRTGAQETIPLVKVIDNVKKKLR